MVLSDDEDGEYVDMPNLTSSHSSDDEDSDYDDMPDLISSHLFDDEYIPASIPIGRETIYQYSYVDDGYYNIPTLIPISREYQYSYNINIIRRNTNETFRILRLLRLQFCNNNNNFLYQ